MGVPGSCVVRGLCEEKLVELTALVATRATRSLCSATKLVSTRCSVEMKRTQSVLHHRRGGSILLPRCDKRDYLSIRVTKIREINAITFSTMEREVQSLKSELRGHLFTSAERLPWTPEVKHRHEVNGHAEYDNRCEICVKSSGISRHPRRVHSVVTRCECFCRVVPRKGQRLKDLEHFLAVMRAR